MGSGNPCKLIYYIGNYEIALHLKTLINILLLFVLPAVSYSQQRITTIEAMASTFNFQGDTAGSGTCFLVNKDTQQYFVTVAHLFKTSDRSGEVVPIQLLIKNKLESFDATIFFHPDRNVDVAIMKLSEKVSQGPGISLDSTNVFFGSQVYFYGFPLRNLGTEAGGIKFPLIKSAIISGQVKYDNVDVIVLDGHNNHGFSGGPVLAYDTTIKKMCIVGVISGYFFEPRKVQYKEDRLSFDENSGIILCYGRRYILDILKKIK